MKDIEKYLVILIFLAVITAIPILSLSSEILEVSEVEFRSLAAEPEYTDDDFWDGSYFRAWETYFLDHIYDRSGWLKASSAFQLHVLDRDVINSVTVTDDVLLNYNIPNEAPYNFTKLADNMAERFAAANELVKSYGGTFLYVGVPEQYSMFRDSYPWYLENNGRLLSTIEDEFTRALEEKGVPFLNMRDKFVETESYEGFYSLTDHHYNLRGAIFTCRTIGERLAEMGRDISFALPEDYELQALPNPFKGSRNRRLSHTSSLKDDFLFYETTVPFKRWDVGDEKPPVVIESPSDDEAPVSYVNYMGGDMAETRILTDRPELYNVLIWGDSFTNALETVFYTGFNEKIGRASCRERV